MSLPVRILPLPPVVRLGATTVRNFVLRLTRICDTVDRWHLHRNVASNYVRICFLLLSGVGGFAEAHCNRLTVRGGLQEKEAVKVTANGWGKGDADFFVELVTDNTRGMLQIRESQTEAGPGLAGGGGQEGGSTEGSKTDEGPVKEQPSIPIVGVRIPGSANENGESRKPAVLVYGEGESAPKEFPLDSPAGPTSPFMVVLQQKSPTEMTVRLFTWIPK